MRADPLRSEFLPSSASRRCLPRYLAILSTFSQAVGRSYGTSLLSADLHHQRMSADLFAEFGVGSAQASNNSHQQQPRPQANSLIPGLETSADDFSANPWDDLNASTLQTTPKTYSSNPGFGHPPQKYDENVLFDASLETFSKNEDDDWGEFESAEAFPGQDQATAQTQGAGRSKSSDISQSVNLIDSLSLEDKFPPVDVAPVKTTAGNVRSYRTQSKGAVHTPVNPPAEQGDSFGNWEEFVDGPPEKPSAETVSKGPERSMPKPPSRGMEHTSPAQVRPTNIPPPSVLLQVFPQLFEQLQQESMRVKRDLQKKGELENAAMQVLYTLKSAARVIAGRTLRWKRDSILSQSMKIGPARSGKQGGMKLNTVNKNENIKEQQEALDVLSMWRDRTALFNSILQAAGKRPIPVIAENNRVMTATYGQGALKASHACALCGLKRDERLPKVDEKVEDSFGEWWVDHWGHTDCKQFWETNMSMLGQR